MHTPPLTPLVDVSVIDMSRFVTYDQYFGNIYPFKTEDEVLASLIREVIFYKLPEEVLELLLEAWNSRYWVDKGYDGATKIKNLKHTAVCNFIHDYHYRCGQGGIESDRIYQYLLMMTGYTDFTKHVRFYVIRTAWLSFYKWKHMFSGNVKPISEVTKKTYKIAVKTL